MTTTSSAGGWGMADQLNAELVALADSKYGSNDAEWRAFVSAVLRPAKQPVLEAVIAKHWQSHRMGGK